MSLKPRLDPRRRQVTKANAHLPGGERFLLGNSIALDEKVLDQPIETAARQWTGWFADRSDDAAQSEIVGRIGYPGDQNETPGSGDSRTTVS
jgi:hypothetical protein